MNPTTDGLSTRLKTAIKAIAGAVLCRLRPKRAALLRHQFTLPYWSPEIRNTWVDRVMRRHIAQTAAEDPTGASLEELHQDFWAHQQESGWYASTADRFETVFRPPMEGYLDALAPLIEAGGIESVCEIGTGAGECLAFLAQRLRGPQRFVGLDLSESQIIANRLRFPELEFVCADAREWVPRNGLGNALFFAVGGVFEYFSSASLLCLMQHVSQSAAPSLFALMFEPVTDGHHRGSDSRSRVHGAEHSFSHNYVELVREAGLKTAFIDRAPPLQVQTISLVSENQAFAEALSASSDWAALPHDFDL